MILVSRKTAACIMFNGNVGGGSNMAQTGVHNLHVVRFREVKYATLVRVRE